MLASKKLVNQVECCVDESIEGYVALNPGLRQLAGHPRVVVRADIQEYKQQHKVTTLTGGGSGHEPCFMGFVGDGLLSAAVQGSVFTSPSAGSILAALRAIGHSHAAGVIVVFNNYTGDRLNFGMAVERARLEGIKVEVVINAEDCAMSSQDKSAGRRGLAALVLISKIIGCMAERGEPIERIVREARQVTHQVGTFGVCLSPCSLPGGGPLFQIGASEIELGMGMHGEAGIKKVQLTSANDVVKEILDHMTDVNNPSHLEIAKGDSIALLVNNMGSTSDLEMNIVVRESIRILENQHGVHVDRAYSSKYAASMEMAGISITLMLLNEERAACLDFPTRAPIWQCPILPHGLRNRFTPSPLNLNVRDVQKSPDQPGCDGAVLTEDEAKILKRAITRACEVLIENGEMLNDLDSVVGDGDCGSTLTNGAKGILDVINGTVGNCRNPYKLLVEMAQSVEQLMGGSSGALYSLFLTSASHQLQSETTITSSSWIRALKRGIDTVSLYGGANPGDRTMLDPLHAAWTCANHHSAQDEPRLVWKAAVDAARLEAERTAGMKAGAGRASYVNAELLTRPDAGAIGCVLWMSAVFGVYEESSLE